MKPRSRIRILVGSLGTVAVAGAVLAFIVTAPRREAEHLLGTPIPDAAQELKLQRVQPDRENPALRYFVRFDISPEGYQAFLDAAHLQDLGITSWPDDPKTPKWFARDLQPGRGRALPNGGFIGIRYTAHNVYLRIENRGP